jgi:hypothetical protein
MKRALYSISLVLVLLIPNAVALEQQDRGAAENPELAQLRIAATQHEIISILLSEENYEEILPEYRRILALGLEGQNEKLVVREAWIVAGRLAEVGRFALAHQLVDETLAVSELEESRFTLLMVKGKVFKEEGRVKDALKVYRDAQKLQD